MDNDINAKLYADVVLYFETNKITAASEEKFVHKRKLLKPTDAAVLYCQEYNCTERLDVVIQMSERYCKATAPRREAITTPAVNLNLYSAISANQRLQQVFFCDTPRNKGYVLEKTSNGWHVSERPCSLDVFRKELKMLGDEAYEKWFAEHLVVGMYEYKPWQPVLEKNRERIYVLNSYKTPTWHNPGDHLGARTWERLSPLMRCFYIHLFPIDEQRAYVFNWMRCTIQCTRAKRSKPKLSTYLTLIGKSGAGKGVFAEHHLKFLHGASNCYQLNVGKITGVFTMSSFYKRTLAVFNEASIKDEQSYDIVKSLESIDQDVEVKGETADMHRTFYNIVWCCNHKDKMRYLAPDDRRFSILDITEDALLDKKVIDPITGDEIVFTREAIEELCSNEKLLLELVEFVLNGQADFTLAETAFKGSKNEADIRRSSRPAWCQELLDCFIDVQWDSPGGTSTKIGYEEVLRCKDDYYTYCIPSKTIERVIDNVTKSRRMVTIPWSALKEEFRKYDHKEVYIYQEPTGARRYAIRIRHADHEEIINRLVDKDIPLA